MRYDRINGAVAFLGLAVEPRRYFLDNVAGWILELDRGEGFPFEGNYSGFLEKKMARLESEAKVDNKRKKALSRELEASFRLFVFVAVVARKMGRRLFSSRQDTSWEDFQHEKFGFFCFFFHFRS